MVKLQAYPGEAKALERRLLRQKNQRTRKYVRRAMKAGKSLKDAWKMVWFLNLMAGFKPPQIDRHQRGLVRGKIITDMRNRSFNRLAPTSAGPYLSDSGVLFFNSEQNEQMVIQRSKKRAVSPDHEYVVCASQDIHFS